MISLPAPPDVAVQQPFVPPTPLVQALDNGIPLWIVPDRLLPLVSLRLVIWGGAATDPENKSGLAGLTDELLFHGAGERDARTFAELSERLAIDLGSSTHGSGSMVTLDTHTTHLETGLDLLADAVLRPRFDKEEIELVKDQQLGAIRQGLDEPETLASWVAMREYFGDAHPLAHPIEGSEAEVERLTKRDIVKSWKERFQADRACFVVSGDVDPDVAKALLDARFGGWARPKKAAKRASPPRAPMPPPRPRERTDYVFVHQAETTQAVLYLVLPSVPATDPRLQPMLLGIAALGGTFTSRLNRLLREEKGFTYGAKAWVDSGFGIGTLEARVAVRAEVTAEALQDLWSEMDKIRAGIDGRELEKARGAKRTSVVEGLATRGGMATIHASLFEDGRPHDGLVHGMARLESSTLEAVNHELGQVDLSHALVVVVGDLGVIREPVEKVVPGPWRVVERIRT